MRNTQFARHVKEMKVRSFITTPDIDRQNVKHDAQTSVKQRAGGNPLY